jgi:hypothetical protein
VVPTFFQLVEAVELLQVERAQPNIREEMVELHQVHIILVQVVVELVVEEMEVTQQIIKPLA